VKVLFPTPPLPERTNIFRLTDFIRSLMKGISGSGPFGPSAQTDWFGHPSHASAFPARSDSVPYERYSAKHNLAMWRGRTGQCSGAFSGTVEGSMVDEGPRGRVEGGGRARWMAIISVDETRGSSGGLNRKILLLSHKLTALGADIW
jgi:hypothetical protein